MSEQPMTDTDRTTRYSDPITEPGGWVGRGAVLYDTREPHRRPCCSEGGRCLAHVTGVYEETTTDEVYYKVADGTWTTSEWVHQDDLLSIYEPAGWSVTGTKPTYLLTRQNGVGDHHDLMTDGGGVTTEASSVVFDRWIGKAGENIDKWGLQDEETLLLAIQEELGELTQAVLEARAEGGDPDRIDEELDDLGALLLQFHERRKRRSLSTDADSDGGDA